MIRRTLSIALALGLAAGVSALQPHSVCAQAAPGGQNLPAGHPSIGGNAPDASGMPAGHPALPGAPKPIAHGSLILHATQGTAGGSNIAGDPVEVDIYSANPTPVHFDGKLDASGTYTIPDITIPGACQPAIKITHSGVPYQGIGQVMDAGHPGEHVEVKVFDTTDKEPKWTIKVRHVMVRRSDAGLDVSEMIKLDNPTDRVWTGAGNAKGQHVSLDLPLPAGAANFQVGGGLTADMAKFVDGHLINTGPLIPGASQFQIGYSIPVTDGKASITITSPVTIEHMMMFVPDDGSTVNGDNLMAAGSGNAGNGTMRFFMSPSIAAGKVVKVEFSKLAAPTTRQAAADDADGAPAEPAAPGAPAPIKSHSSMPVALGIGSGVLVVGGTIAIFMWPGSKQSPKAARKFT